MKVSFIKRKVFYFKEGILYFNFKERITFQRISKRKYYIK